MLFELEGVGLSRGGRLVLDGISAEIPEGVSALVGPSGSGKSSLLRLLDRLADPTDGRVLYRGADLRSLDPLALRREVVLVPQLPALLEGSVADNVLFAAGCGGDPDPDVGLALSRAGLDPSFAERDVGRLSVGEQQRAMLARALALKPRVLLLDEPTSALDEEARDAIEATAAALARDPGVSIVLVTHDPAQADRLAGRVLRLEDGRVVAQGPVQEVLGSR